MAVVESVLSPSQQRHAKQLDQLIRCRYLSAADCLEAIKRETKWTGNESRLSKFRHAQQPMPVVVRKWLHGKVPYGTNFIEGVTSPTVRMVADKLENDAYEEVVSAVNDLITGEYKGNAPEALPQLYALRAVAQNSLGRRLEWLADYTKAAQLAKQYAPKLLPRYELSAISAHADVIDVAFRAGNKTQDERNEQLLKLKERLLKVDCNNNVHDEQLKIRNVLRLASRLDDRLLFTHWLEKAQEHGSFGVTGELADAYLHYWMAPENDDDGDFRNAREYAVYIQLVIKR